MVILNFKMTLKNRLPPPTRLRKGALSPFPIHPDAFYDRPNYTPRIREIEPRPYSCRKVKMANTKKNQSLVFEGERAY